MRAEVAVAPAAIDRDENASAGATVAVPDAVPALTVSERDEMVAAADPVFCAVRRTA